MCFNCSLAVPTFQFSVVARDGGGRTSLSDVTVDIVRNTRPSITNNPLTVDIFNNHTVNTQVFDVDFTDPDTDVSWFMQPVKLKYLSWSQENK